jgi:S1-C subfamily serine protease
MKGILGFKSKKRRGGCDDVIVALDSFIQNFYLGEDLKPEESKKRIENGIVELLQYNQHSSNGLLVTKNGYFITARHCIEPEIRKLKIRLHNQETYWVDKVCVWSRSRDVALVKADIPCECEPMTYKFYNTKTLDDQLAVILTMRDGKITLKSGIINKRTNARMAQAEGIKVSNVPVVSFKEYLFMQCSNTEEGDSGGVVVSLDGRVMGIHTSKLIVREDLPFYKSIKLIEALEVISVYCNHLKKKAEK